MPANHFHFILRLFLAAVLAAFIGLERESHGRPAGLRTHILVAVGACLVMLLSFYGFPAWPNRDPARLAAQVISGIGFLGAGTILREGASIKGLTTAASLWVVAGIGLAIGAGFYPSALAATLIAVVALFFLEKLEKRFISPRAVSLAITMVDRPGQLGEVCSVIGRYGFSIRAIELDQDEEETLATANLQVERRGPARPEQLIEELRHIQGVRRLHWR